MLGIYSFFDFNFVIVSGRLIVHSNDSNYVPVSSWLLNVKLHADEQVFLDKFSLTSFICSCVREKIDNFFLTRNLV